MTSTMLRLVTLVAVVQWSWAYNITPLQQGGEEKNVSACINQTEKTLFIDCGAGYMIRINAFIYGNGEQCSYTPDDCIMKDTDYNLPCVGQRTCSINLPTGDQGRKLPSCDLLSTYIQVNYQCIAVQDSYDICRTPSLQRQWGYIQSPRYPSPYPGADNCTTHLVMQHDQKVRLYLLDFDLEVDHNCVDQLYIQSPLNSQTICGERPPSGQTPFTSHQNTMTLTFNSDGQGQNQGFWLYYEASPLRPDVMTTTTVATSSTTGSTSTSGNTVNIVINKPAVTAREISTTFTHNSADNVTATTATPSTLPIAAIVGGVLGALLFILLILIIFLVVRRMHKRKEKENELKYSNSTNYLNSKTVGISHLQGTPGPYIQNNLNIHNELDDHDKLFYKDELVHKV